MNQYYEQEFTLTFNSSVETESYVRATVDVGHPFKYVMSSFANSDTEVRELRDGNKTGWMKVPDSPYYRVAFIKNGTTINIYTSHFGSGSGTKTIKIYFA